MVNGRTLKDGHPEFARPGLSKLKEKMRESTSQKLPTEWGEKAALTKQYHP